MNATYEKPVILENDMLAEGVYTASGDVADNTDQSGSSSSQSGNYTLKQTNAWDGNKQYDITLTNNSDKFVDSVSVTVAVKGNVTSIGGNVSGTINGSTATITSNNYGNGFKANESVTFYMAITGSGDFSLS